MRSRSERRLERVRCVDSSNGNVGRGLDCGGVCEWFLLLAHYLIMLRYLGYAKPFIPSFGWVCRVMYLF